MAIDTARDGPSQRTPLLALDQPRTWLRGGREHLPERLQLLEHAPPAGDLAGRSNCAADFRFEWEYGKRFLEDPADIREAKGTANSFVVAAPLPLVIDYE
jgi:hypothetical protein